MKTRIFAAFLTLLMVITVLPMQIFAEETTATKDIDDFKTELAALSGDSTLIFDGKGATYEWTIGNTVNMADENAPSRYNSKNAQYYLFEGDTRHITIQNANFKFTAPEGNVTGNIVGANTVVNCAQLYVMTSGNVTFANCNFDGVIVTSFYCEGTSQVINCSFENAVGTYAIKDIRGKEIVVKNNTFNDCSGAIMVSAVSADAAIQSVKIEDNTFTEVANDDAGRGVVQLASLGVYAKDALSFTGNTGTDCGETFRQLNTTADVTTGVVDNKMEISMTESSVKPDGKTLIEITFEAGEGTSAPNAWIYAGDTVTLPTAEREGYALVGWVDEEGELVTDETTFEEATTLTAVWEEIMEEGAECDSDYMKGIKNSLRWYAFRFIIGKDRQ